MYGDRSRIIIQGWVAAYTRPRALIEIQGVRDANGALVQIDGGFTRPAKAGTPTEGPIRVHGPRAGGVALVRGQVDQGPGRIHRGRAGDRGLLAAGIAHRNGQVADTGHVSGKSQAGNRRGGQLRSGGHQAALDVGVARRRRRGDVAVNDRRGNGVITLLGIGVVAENLEPAGNHAAGTRAIAPMDGGGIHAGIPVPIAVGKVGNVQVAGGQVGRVVEINAAGGDPAGRDLSRGGDAAAAVIGCRDYGRIRAALRVSVRAIDVKGRSGTADRARRGLPIPPRNRGGIISGGSIGIGIGESNQGIGEGDARRSAHRILVLERERRVGDRGRAADGEVAPSVS